MPTDYMNNPLFPSSQTDESSSQAATNLIRQKLDRIYADEPSVKKELRELASLDQPLSKHQTFMKQLSTSGKPLAQIQTEWHNYYVSLPDNEKHKVWQEFYESQGNLNGPRIIGESRPAPTHSNAPVIAQHLPEELPHKQGKRQSVAELRQHITRRAQARGRLKPKHHLQSLLFGLGMGTLVILVFLFGFFNEIIIAPFIQPSRHVTSTPLIIGNNTVSASSVPEVIIPKINVQIPVDFNQTTTDESVIEGALNNGIVHYPTTAQPGQQGNAAFFGHSSNNIFNPGKYKFAFVLLHQLVPGDTFYLTFNGKVYVYQVFNKQIVSPNTVSVLAPVEGKIATATLITCDPPGTSINRLVVQGEQISPDPGGNTAATSTTPVNTAPAKLPGNGPTLWSRLWHAVF